MLEITIPACDMWDEVNEEFISTKEQTLKLEHSLVSLSKWESKWCKPFLTKNDKTVEETIDYIKCMTITPPSDPNVYRALTNSNIEQVQEYITAPMTATWFSDDKSAKHSSEQVTSELIYYWMVALQIPFECQKWHLNRLMTLIRVCNVKNKPPKKMSRHEVLSRQAALNKARRKK